jgi:hypothetical protein
MNLGSSLQQRTGNQLLEEYLSKIGYASIYANGSDGTDASVGFAVSEENVTSR